MTRRTIIAVALSATTLLGACAQDAQDDNTSLAEGNLVASTTQMFDGHLFEIEVTIDAAHTALDLEHNRVIAQNGSFDIDALVDSIVLAPVGESVTADSQWMKVDIYAVASDVDVTQYQWQFKHDTVVAEAFDVSAKTTMVSLDVVDVGNITTTTIPRPNDMSVGEERTFTDSTTYKEATKRIDTDLPPGAMNSLSFDPGKHENEIWGIKKRH